LREEKRKEEERLRQQEKQRMEDEKKRLEAEEAEKRRQEEENWKRQEEERQRKMQEEQNQSRYDLPPEADETEEAASGGSVSAVALYDYQAMAEDEISFDPNDIITNIEMVDEGWWIGECHGKFGLFPANYVEVLREDQ